MVRTSKLVSAILAGFISLSGSCTNEDDDSKSKGPAGESNERFVGSDVEVLRKAGVTLEHANEYPLRFGAHSIAALWGRGVIPEESVLYSVRFNGKIIAYLSEAGISPEEAEVYDRRFMAEDILSFAKAGMKPGEANTYSPRFDKNIWFLTDNGIGPGVANQYPYGADEQVIVHFVANGVTPDAARSIFDEYTAQSETHQE